MGKTQKNKKLWENQQKKTIFGDSLGKLHWQNQKKLKKTKKPKNQNFSENVWSEAHVWFFFWFCLGFFVFFGLDLEKTKKTQGFFVFLDKMMVKELWKTKKTQGFFCFSLRSQKESKATNTPKPKKTLSFFSFSRSRPKKNKKNQAKPKKNKHEPQTKHSLKSFGFLVFWFSRGFFDFVFPKIQPKSQKL